MQKFLRLFIAASFLTVSTMVSAQDATLSVWDEFTTDPEHAAMEALVQLCEAQVPGLQIKRTTMDMEAMQNVLTTAINSGEGPDVFYSSPGWTSVGPLIEAGVIKDLTPAYDQYGWRERVQPWAAEYATYNDKVWALPYEAEVQGVFYHRDVFEEHGLSEPETYEEFIEVAQALKEAGYEAPIVTGARPAAVIGWLESAMLGATIPSEQLEQIVLEQGSWDQPVYLNAVERINELYELRLIPEGVLAYSYDDMMTSFFNQASPMVLTGSWIVPNIEGNFPDLNIGYFPVPPLPGVEQKAPKAVGGAFMIAANTDQEEFATQFLDCLATPEAGEIWLNQALLSPPIQGVDLEGSEFSEVRAEVFETISQPESAFNLYGVLPAEVNNETWNAIQAMWAGQMTPEQVVTTKEAAWQRAIEQGDVIK